MRANFFSVRRPSHTNGMKWRLFHSTPFYSAVCQALSIQFGTSSVQSSWSVRPFDILILSKNPFFIYRTHIAKQQTGWWLITRRNRSAWNQIYYRYRCNIQSTLVISKSKGPSKTVRDIRTSTYQSCSIEEKTIWTTNFYKWLCNLTPLNRNVYWKYCGKGEKLLPRSNFSSFPQYFITWF